MTLHVKQGGVAKTVTGLHVKQGGIAKPVQEGWVKQGGVVKKFYSVAAPPPPINYNNWGGTYPQPGPWLLQRTFVVNGDGPYVWAWNEVSSSGGADMTLISGQGTNTATYQATCPGGAEFGGGELIGTITCIGNSVTVNFQFGQVP